MMIISRFDMMVEGVGLYLRVLLAEMAAGTIVP